MRKKKELELMSLNECDINKKFEAKMRYCMIAIFESLENDLEEVSSLQEAAEHKIAVAKFCDLLFPLTVDTPLEKKHDPKLAAEFVGYRNKVVAYRNSFTNIYDWQNYKKEMKRKMNSIMNLWWVHRQNLYPLRLDS